MLKSKLRKFAIAALATGMVAGTATGALAFCFSNDPLSNTSFEVKSISTPDFFRKMEKLSVKVDCNKMPTSTTKRQCFDAKKRVKQNRKGSSKNSKFDRDAQQALKDMYKYASGQPVIGEPTKFFVGGFNAANKAMESAFVAAAEAHMDAFEWLIGNFKKTVTPDGTQCCNWKTKSCNPTGKKNGKLHFRIAYAGTSRVVEMGATDHLECRIDKKTRRSVCINYVFPQSPYRAHKKTARGRLLKSKHSGKCLDVWLKKKGNGANVAISKCHGGKNQRWTVYRNGVIRSDFNGKCLDVATGPTKPAKNGANVHLWDCHGGLSQRWSYGRQGKIISRARGKHNWCLDVSGWKKKNGTNVHVWRCGDNQANQNWRSAKK